MRPSTSLRASIPTAALVLPFYLRLFNGRIGGPEIASGDHSRFAETAGSTRTRSRCSLVRVAACGRSWDSAASAPCGEAAEGGESYRAKRSYEARRRRPFPRTQRAALPERSKAYPARSTALPANEVSGSQQRAS